MRSASALLVHPKAPGGTRQKCLRPLSRFFCYYSAVRGNLCKIAVAMNIKIYQDEKGNNPYLRWLKKLKDRQAQLKIEKRLAQLRLERYRQSTKILGGLSEWLAKQ
jgi:hypothetical protein